MSGPDETPAAKPKCKWEHFLTFNMRGSGDAGDLYFSSKEKMNAAMAIVTTSVERGLAGSITHISGSAFIDCSEVVAVTAYSIRSRDYGNDDY